MWVAYKYTSVNIIYILLLYYIIIFNTIITIEFFTNTV